MAIKSAYKFVFLLLGFCLATAGFTQTVILSELNDPSSNFQNDRYIEITNIGDQAANLSEYEIRAIVNQGSIPMSFSWFPTGILAPGASVTFGGENSSQEIDFQDPAWQNSNGTVQFNWNGQARDGAEIVRVCDGLVLDRVLASSTGETSPKYYENGVIRRKGSVCQQNLNSYQDGEWESKVSGDDYTDFKAHTSSCLNPVTDKVVCCQAINSVRIRGDFNVCVGETKTYDFSFTGGEPNIYNWSVTGGTVIGANNASQLQVLWDNINSATIKLSVSNDCSGPISDNQIITINDTPEVDLGNDTIVCPSANINIPLDAGNSGSSYVWTPNNEISKTILVQTTGTFGVTVTDANGCSASDEISVTEYAPLQLSISESQSISCYGFNDGALTVQVSSGQAPYNYSWTDADGGNRGNSKSISDLSPNEYTVEVIDDRGCEGNSSYALTEPNELIIDSIRVLNHVQCKGGNDGRLEVFAKGGTGSYIYDWGFGTSSKVKNGLSAGAFSVTIYDERNCNDTETQYLNEPLTHVDLSLDSDSAICNATTGKAWGRAFDGTIENYGDYSFQWYNESGQMINGANTDTLFNATKGNYVLEVRDANNCAHQSNIEVKDGGNILPVSLINTQNPTCPDFCDGEAMVYIETETNAPYRYLISNANGADEFNLVSRSFNYNTLCAGEGANQLKVIDAFGCESDVIDVELVAVDPIEINLVFDTIACDSTGNIAATATGGNGGYQYTWSNTTWNQDRNGSQLTNVNGGDFLLTVEDANNCTQIEAFTNYFHVPTPNIDFSLSYEEPLVIISNVDYLAESDAVISEWQMNLIDSLNGEVLMTRYGQENTMNLPNKPGIYAFELSVLSDRNCSVSLTKYLEVKEELSVFVPNAFTPDGDDVNQKFGPVITGVLPGTYSFEIYSRWGESVFETQNTEQQWDGWVYENGTPTQKAQTGIYVYRMTLKAEGDKMPRIYNGTVQLIR